VWCVTDRDCEASTMKSYWPNRGCCAVGGKTRMAFNLVSCSRVRYQLSQSCKTTCENIVLVVVSLHFYGKTLKQKTNIYRVAQKNVYTLYS
jgi:hypothetical protein